MKKLVVAVLMAAVMLTGCNRAIIDTNYAFNKAYIDFGDRIVEVDVKSWSPSDGEDLTIVATDGTVYMCSYMNCVMVYEKEK